MIDGVGNIWFIVYGYMNRGINEGRMGVCLYYYDCAVNTIEEMLFIPYTKSYDILAKEVDSLAYISSRNRMYILLDGTVYTINITSRESEIMQDSISETGFYSSDDESTIAWQTGEAVIDRTQIQVFRLNSMTPSVISSGAGEVVIPFGFMDNDIVYGVAKISDVTTDYTGRTMIPMYSIRIEDMNGNIMKDYGFPGEYVLDVEKRDNMLILTRVRKDPETGDFVPMDDDQIVNNKTQTTLKNKLSAVVTEKTETTYQTVLYKGGEEGRTAIKVTNPKEVVFEGGRDVAVSGIDRLKRYYVYAKGALEGIYTSASEAVNTASEYSGVVVNKQMLYIWETGDRKTSARLTEIESTGNGQEEKKESARPPEEGEGEEEKPEEAVQQEQNTSYAACLDVMLRSGGVYKSSEDEIRTKSLVKVLSDNMDADVLDLSGCRLEDMLYYISCGTPVMALTGDRSAVIITGYEGKTVVIYDPEEETVKKMGIYECANMFERAGNRFITYR